LANLDDILPPGPDWVSRRFSKLERDVRELRAALTKTQPIVGTGSPEGVVVAGVGALYLRTDGGASSTLYVKEGGTGSSGWVAK
jgi:hypothetical protein